jgi:carbon-monoxide dehydrogenase large subunit
VRREDHRLLTGRGRFTADLDLPGAARGVFLRADRPHARIVATDLRDALAMPGVFGILTGEDVRRAGQRGFWVNASRDGVLSPLAVPFRPALAMDRVMFVGEAVALVVAATAAEAQDAAERIVVEYEDLPHVTDAVEALAPGAPRLYEDVPGNLVFAQEHGDAAATDAALAAAPRVVRIALRNNRLVPSPLEPRAVLAAYEEAAGAWRIAVGTQGMPAMRKELAEILGVAPSRVHVETGDVGGGFGAKTPAYPEYVALLLAARACGRPVKWIASRSEAFLADHHGRDGLLEGEVGLDDEGRFLAMRFRFTSNMGAHLTSQGVYISAHNPGRSISGVYRTPAIHGTIRCAVTNTAVVGPYRGAGRPEMATVIERLVDAAADAIGMDRVALRRRNLIDAMPWTTATGVTYDSGDFRGVLDDALRHADWAGFEARRSEAAARGRLRGIGLSCFLEATGGPPVEGAAIRFERDAIVIHCGTQSNGQGHETVFPALVAEFLGVPPERVRLVQGNALVPLSGGPSVASRSLIAAGGAFKVGCDLVIERGRALAADALEAAAEDIEFTGGAFRVAGTDRAIALAELAARHAPAEGPHPLDADAELAMKTTFPNGCHVAEVEIDPETGVLEVVRYTAVDDFGVVRHPVIVAGQVHGGVAQGLGQALAEDCRYDPASGQLLSGSFMDYALPRADLVPPMAVHEHATRCAVHPLGAKGCGEAGATAAPAALFNAACDALRGRGIRRLDMPLTPHALWRALRSGA